MLLRLDPSVPSPCVPHTSRGFLSFYRQRERIPWSLAACHENKEQEDSSPSAITRPLTLIHRQFSPSSKNSVSMLHADGYAIEIHHLVRLAGHCWIIRAPLLPLLHFGCLLPGVWALLHAVYRSALNTHANTEAASIDSSTTTFLPPRLSWYFFLRFGCI